MEVQTYMDKITLSIGTGGEEMTHFLEETVFPVLEQSISGDAAIVGRTAFTIDSFVADPPFFPGGSIGTLAVSGTVNDLVAAGARPSALALSLILEEGLDTDVVRRVLEDVRMTSKLARVKVVTGDTKVVQRGAADKIFITTSGIGEKVLEFSAPLPGDAVIVTGDIARHGAAMLLASKKFDLEAQLTSDCEPLYWLPDVLQPFQGHLRWMRDPTRGGVGTILQEFCREFSLGVRLFQEQVPIIPEVTGVCELLGIEPLHLASEGRMVIVISPHKAHELLELLKPFAPNSSIIGEVVNDHKTLTKVVDGYETYVPPLTGEILPRIC